MRRLQPPRSEERDTEARSAAERFLFDLLEMRPSTAGLFALNGGLGFSFGPKEAEADLFADSLGLVIELDGYFHFQDDEVYRRDRRKDWELQRRGFVVLRFLSDDVAARLEEILDTIESAVDHCRGHARCPRKS